MSGKEDLLEMKNNFAWRQMSHSLKKDGITILNMFVFNDIVSKYIK